MNILKSKKERQKLKMDKLLTKETIEQLNQRLLLINRQFIDKIDELEQIKSSFVGKQLFLEVQQENDNKLTALQKNVYEEINNKIDNNYKELFTKYQQIIKEKNDELISFHKEFSDKVSKLDNGMLEFKNIKEEFLNLMNNIIKIQSDLTKFKLLEESYKDTAIKIIEDKINSKTILREVANQGSKLILDAFNEELSEFPIKEQKSLLDAIKTILENKSILLKDSQDEPGNVPEPLNMNEIFHQTYGKVKNSVLSGVIPMVVGPAGSGKSHAMQQIARDLNLNFYMANRIQNTFELVGFVDAAGKYVTTQFYEAFTKGGLFFFDEVDASSPEALVTINAAVAQGHMAFPGHSKNEPMHKDFKAVVAGNTYGTGSTLQYTGRNKLDAATLDRFIVIDWNYDHNLEDKKVNDKQLLEICWTLRSSVKKLQEEFSKANKNRDNNPYDSIIISTRGIENLEKILQQELKVKTMTNEELFKSKFFASTKKEVLNQIYDDIRTVNQISKNKYFKNIETVLTS